MLLSFVCDVWFNWMICSTVISIVGIGSKVWAGSEVRGVWWGKGIDALIGQIVAAFAKTLSERVQLVSAR